MNNSQETIEQRLMKLIEQYKGKTEALTKILSSINHTQPIVTNNEAKNNQVTDSAIINSSTNKQHKERK